MTIPPVAALAAGVIFARSVFKRSASCFWQVGFPTDPLQGQSFLGRHIRQAVGLGDRLVGDLAAGHVEAVF